jgi:hypothetical protein
MTVLREPNRVKGVQSEAAEAKAAPEAMPPAPITITEQEVLFSTAAAVPVRSRTIRWWSKVTGVALAAVHRTFLTSTPDGVKPRRHYPQRYEFLESARLAREMDRL